MKKIFLLFLILPLYAYAWDLGSEGNFGFEAVAKNVYVMHGPLGEPSEANQGFMNNPGIIVAEEGIIMVDPGGTYQVGKQVLEEVEKISDKPVIAVFNTHIHGDHWLGNQAVKERWPNAKIYAHPEMIKQANGEQGLIWVDMMERMTHGKSKGTRVVAPENQIQHSDKIEIAGENFRIHSFAPAHTNTDVMIEHVESKTLFTGDNSFNGRMGRFDSSSNMHGNIDVLHYAMKLDLSVYVPGHGKTATKDQSVKPFLNYLEQVKEAVKIGYEEGIMDYEIKDNVLEQFAAYQHWVGFEHNFGRHINKMYLETEALDL